MRETAGGQNMKKIWTERKDEGVSPVIATILMVAITVVLAAVLYVMVMGIQIDPDIQGSGGIQNVDIKSNISAEIVFGTFGTFTHPTDVKLILEDNDGARVTLTWPTVPDTESYPMKSSDADVSATYKDFTPIANEINPGDSILVVGLNPGARYEIMLVDIEGNQYSLVGDTEFSMPS